MSLALATASASAAKNSSDILSIGFARVGDGAAAEQALRIAESLAAEIGDRHAPARIRARVSTSTVTPEAGR